MRFVEIHSQRYSIDTPELEAVARAAVAASGFASARVFYLSDSGWPIQVVIDGQPLFLVPSLNELDGAEKQPAIV